MVTTNNNIQNKKVQIYHTQVKRTVKQSCLSVVQVRKNLESIKALVRTNFNHLGRLFTYHQRELLKTHVCFGIRY